MSQLSMRTEDEPQAPRDLLPIIRQMAEQEARVFARQHGEYEIQERIRGLNGTDVGAKCQEAYERDCLKALEHYQFFLVSSALFRDHGRKPEVESLAVKEAELGDAQATTTEIPAFVDSTIHLEIEHDEEKIVAADDKVTIEPKEEGESEPQLRTDFSDPANAITSIPKKGSNERAQVWTNMEINMSLLEQINQRAKQGLFFKFQPQASQLLFIVSLKEASVRPVVTIHLQDNGDLEKARALFASKAADDYMTQPPLPVMLNVKFSKLTKSPAYKDLQQGSVNVELLPATIGQVAKAALILEATQKANWVGDEKTWKWDAAHNSKSALNGTLRDVVKLMKSNPVFIREATRAADAAPTVLPSLPPSLDSEAWRQAAETYNGQGSETDSEESKESKESSESGQSQQPENCDMATQQGWTAFVWKMLTFWK